MKKQILIGLLGLSFVVAIALPCLAKTGIDPMEHGAQVDAQGTVFAKAPVVYKTVGKTQYSYQFTDSAKCENAKERCWDYSCKYIVFVGDKPKSTVGETKCYLPSQSAAHCACRKPGLR